MKEIILEQRIMEVQFDELSADDRELVERAIEATGRSYAVYSHFCVGAALRLDNGEIVIGCNQENASFPVGICAERAALFAAGSSYPDVAVHSLAIAARNAGGLLSEPVSPCGICRQAIVETEVRFCHPVRLLLYGARRIYIAESVKALLPLTFSEV